MTENPEVKPNKSPCGFLNADYMSSGRAVVSESIAFDLLAGYSLSDLRQATELQLVGNCTLSDFDKIESASAFKLECPRHSHAHRLRSALDRRNLDR